MRRNQIEEKPRRRAYDPEGYDFEVDVVACMASLGKMAEGGVTNARDETQEGIIDFMITLLSMAERLRINPRPKKRYSGGARRDYNREYFDMLIVDINMMLGGIAAGGLDDFENYLEEGIVNIIDTLDLMAENMGFDPGDYI